MDNAIRAATVVCVLVFVSILQLWDGLFKKLASSQAPCCVSVPFLSYLAPNTVAIEAKTLLTCLNPQRSLLYSVLGDLSFQFKLLRHVCLTRELLPEELEFLDGLLTNNQTPRLLLLQLVKS